MLEIKFWRRLGRILTKNVFDRTVFDEIFETILDRTGLANF